MAKALPQSRFFQRVESYSRIDQRLLMFLAILAFLLAPGELCAQSLANILQSNEFVVLADVKHGVRDRIGFFSSNALFEAMSHAGVRHVAIEMPRVLGREAMSIETEADVEAFAQDVLRSGSWHFVDADHPEADSADTQFRAAVALGHQVLLSKQFGIDAIFYDFNNPLEDFATYNDPVYRCLATRTNLTFRRYSANGEVTKSQRDAAIMRERLSHDDELAAFIERAIKEKGGGKFVVIPGYAHAVVPGALVDRIARRLNLHAKVIAIFKDENEYNSFYSFLWQQAHLLSIDLSRSPNYFYTIADGKLRDHDSAGKYQALNDSGEEETPAICSQVAHAN
ncbi:MAG: hypothetical protein JSR99_01555 [Proteobacteria bacterium]|nr:hypothetical protein [Pseudomonadota bacterium]